MFDLHSHFLPGLDEEAPNLDMSLATAQSYVDQGVFCVALHAVDFVRRLSKFLHRHQASRWPPSAESSMGLAWHSGWFLAPTTTLPWILWRRFKHGWLLTLAEPHYVLVEPSHHAASARFPELPDRGRTASSTARKPAFVHHDASRHAHEYSTYAFTASRAHRRKRSCREMLTLIRGLLPVLAAVLVSACAASSGSEIADNRMPPTALSAPAHGAAVQ